MRRVSIDSDTFRLRDQHTFINWGSSKKPQFLEGKNNRIVNSFERVQVAAHKLKTFDALKIDESLPIPLYTTDRAVATDWVQSGTTVLCRTRLTAHSGEGIVICGREEDVVDCPLYVQYIKKKKEFRVHVAFGNVIDIQEKRRRSDYDGEPNFTVRNHHTGWVYCREEILEPETLQEIAVRAVSALELDFGAVDIIWNQHHDKCYVLEVNTACGLEGSTVEAYTEAFQNNLTF